MAAERLEIHPLTVEKIVDLLDDMTTISMRFNASEHGRGYRDALTDVRALLLGAGRRYAEADHG